MTAIEPTSAQAKGLLRLPKDQPVVMLNLLKFFEKTKSGESGETAYLRYVENLRPLLEKAGGELVWSGHARHILIGNATETWDRVIMVRYPSPRDFIRMSSSQEYRAIHHDREAGLERTELIVTQEDEGLAKG